MCCELSTCSVAVESEVPLHVSGFDSAAVVDPSSSGLAPGSTAMDVRRFARTCLRGHRATTPSLNERRRPASSRMSPQWRRRKRAPLAPRLSRSFGRHLQRAGCVWALMACLLGSCPMKAVRADRRVGPFDRGAPPVYAGVGRTRRRAQSWGKCWLAKRRESSGRARSA